MDYLRTLGSAAVLSLVQKSGLNLPFTLGPKVTSFEGFWTLYDATKRDDGSAVSVFEYDFTKPHNAKLIPLAKNALRKLRTIRHPDVLKYVDAVESDNSIFIVTERVRPLIGAEELGKGQSKEDWVIWGVHRISVALAFINDFVSSTHGNVRPTSVFVAPSGEWKLGGFEVLSNPADEASVLYTLGGLMADSMTYASPEVKKGGWSSVKETSPAATDAYALGLLLHSVFNPTQPPPPTSLPPHPPPAPSTRGSIPTSIWPSYKTLLNPNPRARMTAKGFLDLGMAESAAEGGFFVNNKLVKVCKDLENFALASDGEKAVVLRTLKDQSSLYPSSFATYLILPRLLTALQYGGASAAAILPLVLLLSKGAGDSDPEVVIKPIVALYKSPDRGTRMALLDSLGEYVDKLDQKVVVNDVWPNLQTGFSDTVAVIREATVKSIILLAPKLSDRIMNNDLLRYLAKMQTDPEASIRTNTCILIGRLGPQLGYNTKRKMLVPAFARALKDPFVHTRVAGLMAFMASVDLFDAEACSGKVVPCVSVSLIDKEKLVRDQAFKAIELFVKKLEAHAATMPEIAIVDDVDTASISTVAVPLGQTTLVNSATGAASALAGWAISSLGKKLAASDMQSVMNGVRGIDTPTSAPPPPTNGSVRPSSLPYAPSATSAANSTVSSPAIIRQPSPGPSGSKTKGMQLGGSKVPASVTTASLTAQWEEEVAAEEGMQDNPWGTDDLIDINADEDDWTAFESAPAGSMAVEPILSSSSLGLSNSPSLARDQSDDPWGGMESSSSHATIPIPDPWKSEPDPWRLSTAPTSHDLTSKPKKLSVSSQGRSPSMTSTPSVGSTPMSSPPPSGTDVWEPIERKTPTPIPSTPNLAGMSKEEKAAEMARRKEERKQRIALLKEQKKTASGKS